MHLKRCSGVIVMRIALQIYEESDKMIIFDNNEVPLKFNNMAYIFDITKRTFPGMLC